MPSVDNSWSSTSLVPTQQQRYLWKFEYIYYSDGSVEVTDPVNLSIAGVDADTSGVTDAINKNNQAIEEAKQQLETVRNDSLASAEEAKQQLATVADDLSKAKTDFQNAVSAVDTKATNLQSDLTQAKQDLASQAQQLQAQAIAQSELTKRVSSVEKTANGTKTTVGELSKTVAQNGKDITSVTARTKVVEDDLTSTKTTLSQVKTTADSTSQKTATLESGLNGLSAKFENLKVGSRNYFKKSKSRKYYIDNRETQDVRTVIDDEFWQNDTRFTKDYVRMSFDIAFNPALPSDFTTNVHFSASPWYDCGGITFKGGTTALQHFDLKFNLSGAGNSYKTDNVFIRLKNTIPLNTAVSLENFNLYLSAVVEDYNQNDADIESKVAEYKQTADQNYASLQTTVQNLDGTVQHNKTVADQTAQGFTTRIESLETYKDGESERASQYFEASKTETAKQLTAERTAIAKDYVAKSTYTSDVTGIRNELSATTTTANATKTNLANYQASNDKVVASLKSSLQTTDGNVSNLQTKVEAVPGQITSAVSAVEGKIPTNVSTRNLILKSNDFANPHKQSGANTTVTSTNDYFVIKSTGYTANAWGGISWNMSISEVKAGEQFSILMPVYIDSSVDLDGGFQIELKRHVPGTNAYVHIIPDTQKDRWFNVAITFKTERDVVFDSYPFYVRLLKNGLVRIKPPMLVRGNLIPSDYQQAPEDTSEQISSLSSELKQTKDGITLLATKTELNTAKNELQSGINTATNKANSAQSTANNNAQTISTHTTQISALNTGLSAKVSQTDFNTLSGRVTTAENNITAKANELSSKISSVEGKIPTSSGGRNLAQGTSKDWSKPFTGFSGVQNTTKYLYRVLTDGLSVGDTIKTRIVLKYTDIVPASGKTAEVKVQGAGNVTDWKSGAYPSGGGGRRSISGSGEIVFELTDKITANHLKNDYWNMGFRTDWIASGSLQWRLAKAERGMFFTDWSPAPEDTAEQISNLSSEIKQTADGITLLATKTELNTAKNELQSGITTATNKANSNAQTISTHTTQISALNTGLQAKVSQTDFNTLSGRVTTAENNITAKANELSSKISSVEGKIPTTVGGRNYIKNSEYRKVTIRVNDNQNQDEAFDISSAFWQNSNVYAKKIKLSFYYQASVAYETERKFQVLFRTKPWPLIGEVTYPANTTRLIKYTLAMTSTLPANFTADQIFIRFNGNLDRGRYHNIEKVMLEISDVFSDWQPAPEDYDSKLASAQSEIKQTTDSIKASVSSVQTAASNAQSTANTAVSKADAAQAGVNTLDSTTVKSSSLTINADGIVMKAGKSTTDVANAIGSYFAVNQNAINLFSDKINVKGSMIVDGAITGDKIKANSVDVSKIVGIDADYIKAKIEYAMIDWLKGKTITAYNDNMTIDLQDGRISFKDGSNAVYRQTPDGIHTGFLHFEAGSQGGIYAAFGATSTRQGINSKSSEFAGIRCYRVSANGDSHEAKIDKIEVIGDTVQFGHGYRSDGTIGGGFIMDTAAYANETPYSFNRVIKSIEALWRILHDHAKNTGYRFDDSAFINALNNEYNAWHDMHND